MGHGKPGGGPRRQRTPAEKAAQRARTAANKQRILTALLARARGEYAAFLRRRLAYWAQGGKAVKAA